MNVEVQPYFSKGEKYPALIGVRAEGDEYETAYVSKSELVDALAENAKLVVKLNAEHIVRQNVEIENTKLRERNRQLCELCDEQLDNLMPEICAKAWWCDGKDWHTCDDDACGNYTFVILARELGAIS